MVATQGAGWRLAPSLVALIDEADRLWPDRSKASDGSIGDPSHQTRPSDHNPTGGWVHAVDLTHDPAHEVDAWTLANRIKNRADQRVQYLVAWSPAIGRDAIWNPDIKPEWRDKGTNDHASHLHVSIRHTDSARADVRPWWPATNGEDDMPYSEEQLIVFATAGAITALGSDNGKAKIADAVADGLAEPDSRLSNNVERAVYRAVTGAVEKPDSPLSNALEALVGRAVKALLATDPDGRKLVDGK